jgi:amino acid transporter
MTKIIKNISMFALVMLITGAVDGVRNLPSIALFGSSLIFFFVAGALLFLIPTGLVSAELCKQTHQEGGIYAWTKVILGKKIGLLAVWLQWINTMAWFPTCLTAIVGTLIYVIHPAWGNHPLYLVSASLLIFWTMTLLSLKGVHQSAKIASWATTIGMVVPMCLIIGLCFLWLIMGKPLALHLGSTDLIPAFNHLSSWNSLTAIITSFLGMELATVHVNKIKNAPQIFPKALMLSVGVIILTMGFGSLGVALVIPQNAIQLVSGTIQAFDVIFTAFHMTWMGPVLAVMLVFGSLGAMINWLISPANGLLQAAKDGYLPQFFSQENKHGSPQNMLIVQGVAVSVISGFFFLLPSVNGSYWFLMDLSTELYVLMYVLMFIAAFIFFVKAKKIVLIPGKKYGAMLVALLGLLGCLITVVVGFLPPSGVDVGGAVHYMSLFSLGLFLMISPVLLLYGYKYLKEVKK